MRIGHGYDVHRLVSGRALILGGVTIPYEKGLDGHSDADVLVHAVMAAAHAFGQIFFPHRMVVLLTVLLGAVPALVPLKIILVVFAV